MSNQFSGKQLKCIELMALGTMTQIDIARDCRCNTNTITKWKRNPEFMALVVDRARALLKESVPDIYKALSDKSKTGSDKHIKIFLDHLEKLEEAKAGVSAISFTWKGPTDTTPNE